MSRLSTVVGCFGAFGLAVFFGAAGTVVPPGNAAIPAALAFTFTALIGFSTAFELRQQSKQIAELEERLAKLSGGSAR
jgi:hypothetical protein